MRKPLHLLFALIPVALASCATSVRFDVERPPIVDLRGVSRITVIPFERNSLRGFEHLSAYVTAALSAGVRDNVLRGNLVFVEPQTLTHVPHHNLWQHVDVFITGRIIEVNSTDNSRESFRIISGEEVRVTTITLTVTVYIEYSYIRARDGRVLGTFRKRERLTDTAERIRGRQGPGGGGGNRPGGGWDQGHWNHPNWNRPGPWNNPGWFDPDRDRDRGRGRRGRPGDTSPRRNSWIEDIARSAINRFSLTMDRELAPWTTTESRTLRRGSRNEPMLDEARRLVRMGRYDQALQIYREIYEQEGSVSAGFNTALLFAVNDQFTEALELLEALHRGLLASGQSTPRFVRREIQRMAEFVNGFRILDEYRASRPIPTAVDGVGAFASPQPWALVAAGNEPASVREARGTVNLDRARVYALSGAIAYAADNSIWSKIIASTDASVFEGRWFMRIPDTAPSLLWFVVSDGHGGLYITRTALGTFGTVVLDTAWMTRLE